MNYKPHLIARVPTQNPSDLEDPVILTSAASRAKSNTLLKYHFSEYKSLLLIFSRRTITMSYRSIMWLRTDKDTTFFPILSMIKCMHGHVETILEFFPVPGWNCVIFGKLY